MFALGWYWSWLLPVSIFGPLLFLIYVNDLPNGLKKEGKLFVDDTSLFSVAHDVMLLPVISKNLISPWVFQCKMIFKSDTGNLRKSIIRNRNKMKSSHPSVYFNKNFGQFNLHKHLDGKLSYEHHLKYVSNIVKKTLGLLLKF